MSVEKINDALANDRVGRSSRIALIPARLVVRMSERFKLAPLDALADEVVVPHVAKGQIVALGVSQLVREFEDRMGICEKKQGLPRIASILENGLDHVVPAMVRETRVVLSGIEADHGIHR